MPQRRRRKGDHRSRCPFGFNVHAGEERQVMTDKNDKDILLTRDGHVTELTFDRYLIGELTENQEEILFEHINECSHCAEELEIARGFYGEADSVESADGKGETSGVIDLETRRRRRRTIWVVSACAAALAAVLGAVVVQQQSTTPDDAISSSALVEEVPSDAVRIRGEAFSLEVWAAPDEGDNAAVGAGASPRPVNDGDVIDVGDRLGFRIFTGDLGDVMIVGVSSDGEAYQVFPGGDGGDSKPMKPRPQGDDLDVAILPDDKPGREHLIAITCPESFQFADVEAAIETAIDENEGDALAEAIGESCVISETRLEKRARQ